MTFMMHTVVCCQDIARIYVFVNPLLSLARECTPVTLPISQLIHGP